MSIGRTIRIYLDDGSVTGIRHAEIVNWTGQAISSPRRQLSSLNHWPESKKPGVYFLFGVDDETGNSATYIGEAENVFERLQNHLVNKDFWNEVVFFTSKDENLTKSHVKYLESRLVTLAKGADRDVVLNRAHPQIPALPRGDRDAMEEFIGNLRTLLGVIGHKTLEQLGRHENIVENDTSMQSQQTAKVTYQLTLTVKNIVAHAIIDDEGIVVLKGSTVSRNTNKSLSKGYLKLRRQLQDNKVIFELDGTLRFAKDQIFTSPSQAAAIIVGYPMNGRLAWQTHDGISLKDLEEMNIKKLVS